MHIIEITALLQNKSMQPILDVRSEGEYFQGHIPDSINIALLNNEDRKLVGTCYKEKGSEAAVVLGYELVGGKFGELIRKIGLLFPDKNVILHCWRGGLRSKIVAQLLENSGFEVSVLKGGYKTYRHWVLESLEQEIELKVVGGLTGSGKTELLHMLEAAGEQIIDLEGLANHRGSAFGGIGQPPQPTQEQFENNLAECISIIDSKKDVWIEDESRRIGTNCLPEQLWESIRKSTLFEIELDSGKRLDRILRDYAILPADKLKEKTMMLKKRLGDKRLQEIIRFLEEGNMTEWASALLSYYDKNYLFGQNKRELLKRKKINLNHSFSAKDFLSAAKG